MSSRSPLPTAPFSGPEARGRFAGVFSTRAPVQTRRNPTAQYWEIPHCGSRSSWPRRPLPLSLIPGGVTQGAWPLRAAAGAERLRSGPHPRQSLLFGFYPPPLLRSVVAAVLALQPESGLGGAGCPRASQGTAWRTAGGGPPSCRESEGLSSRPGFSLLLSRGGGGGAGLPSLGAGCEGWKRPGGRNAESGSSRAGTMRETDSCRERLRRRDREGGRQGCGAGCDRAGQRPRQSSEKGVSAGRPRAWGGPRGG